MQEVPDGLTEHHVFEKRPDGIKPRPVHCKCILNNEPDAFGTTVC